MKIQTGFISSSSSCSIEYSSHTVRSFAGYSSVENVLTNVTSNTWEGAKYKEYSPLSETTVTQTMIWTTKSSTSYQRIETFLEAVEKMNSPYSRNQKSYLPLYDYSKNVARRDIYNGFVDIVITFPCKIRIAGLELINPWVGKLPSDPEYNYWRFLPREFAIFKVDDEKVNANLDKITYKTDIARIQGIGGADDYTIRPVKYSKVENDPNLIFLGKYTVDWETMPSYKCFFKYNSTDKMTLNLYNHTDNLGTATWECKEVVLRIFKAYTKDDDKYDGIETNDDLNSSTLTPIEKKVCQYILEKEIGYGSTDPNGEKLKIENVEDFWKIYKELYNTIIDQENMVRAVDEITSALNDSEDDRVKRFNSCIKFGSSLQRSYGKVTDLFFPAGLEYKLGGIQVLLSPDIFSVAEMKMYNYADTTNNKVFIGEWDKDLQEVEYYGTGTIKTSEYIDVSSANANCIVWKHNFNVPPKYLDVQVFAKFTMDFDSFCAGDVVTNLVNINREPLTMRLTGTDVMLNISKGICFTNPATGEFMSFKDGFGVQMDREGSFGSLQAALDVGANVLAAQSIVASKIEPAEPGKADSFPFRIYFVVKRLF